MFVSVVLGLCLLVNVTFCIASEETAPAKTGLLHNVANPSTCLYNGGFLTNGGYMVVGDCPTDWRGLIDTSKISDLESDYGNFKFANGFCVTNYGQSPDDKVPLRSWNCDDATSNQLKIIDGTVDSFFRLALESFGGSKCVARDPSNDYGVQSNCLQNSSSSYNYQAWVIESTDNTWKVLESFSSPGKCVNYDSENAFLVLDCSREYKNQIVALTKMGDYYSIKFVFGSRCLEISSCGKLTSNTCGNGAKQDFIKIEVKGVGIRLKARNGDFCLTTEAGAVNVSPCNEDLYDFSQIFNLLEFNDLPRRYNLKGLRLYGSSSPLPCLKSLVPGTLSQLIIQDCSFATATFAKFDNNVYVTSGSVQLNGNCLTLGDENIVWENKCGNSTGQDWFAIRKVDLPEPLVQIKEVNTGMCLTGKTHEVAYVKPCGETEIEEYQLWYLNQIRPSVA